MEREVIRTDGAPQPIGPYVQAVRVGQFVFTAGQIPLDPASGRMVEGGIEEQTERVLENLKAILEAAGSSLSRVVRTTCFLADLEDFAAFNRIYAKYFGENPPPRTTVQAARLPAGALVEIDCIAIVE
ncbi:RidA family protein [Thermomicrobium roseum]|jgi:2-iminobutanoate/2-iminopropanoate deaminase|uniref:Putative endoribonuclease L-PSP n=1 Tax=Thermomicrobium roseum (strain ATCC 27502 / DSM 5159 / P-2) TaxID=309801 RepID=B9KZF3_THERP|nr:RidA family protein [Thermomicrobium roseum]ACM05313.1 putative endoribonuclease L-PSP [Thermomicrobium roseum DSM 5159]